MKKRYKFALGAGLLLAGLYVNNASWIAGIPDGEMTLVSHRGVHQTFHRDGLNNETCTAEHIFKPRHEFLENTIESFDAAIYAGAEQIELDIHPTTDGEFVVFHDWTLDCRTDGTGKTRDHDLAYLKALDIGYGYTSDYGRTFPFRGKFTGKMPTLNEVLTEFSDTHFIINFKSRSKSEAASLLDYLDAGEWSRLSVSGHVDPVSIVRDAHPKVRGMVRSEVKQCLKSYVLTGWSGFVPKSCYNMTVPVPANYRKFFWGWPHRFEKRLNKVGSRSLLMGEYTGTGSTGIDSMADLEFVPKNYKGMVWTNTVEWTGPELNSRGLLGE
ncbi:MAG: glycerophosphodiester phosphodiesterase [Hellea sp.]|nr:glycerophosphodiester phosphodiesterase [Hellea sp.]